MPLVVGVVALRHGEQISLQQAQHLVEVVVEQCQIHLSNRGDAFVGVNLHIVRQQALHQPDAYLLIGDVERVKVGRFVIVFYCEISRLVEQRNHRRHAFGRGIECRCHRHCWFEHRRQHIKFLQFLNQECGRAAFKPVALDSLVEEGVEKAKRIEQVG